ncbi:MAG: polysaccharide pyruvyl transferase family protein, partial [Coprococcus sp.]
EIPSERKKEYEENLKTFKAISVREKQGTKIVKDLADREAAIVLDPTLLLDENGWRSVEKKSYCCPKHKYVFVYALGDKNDRFEEKIKQLREKYEIFDVRSIQKNGKELPVGPSEFLYLLRNAEVVLTDSFHATVFSIIFHKRFITFNRSGLNMNSRIESLAELIDVEKCLNEFGDLECNNEIDYMNVDTILKEERRKSIEFLEKALNN